MKCCERHWQALIEAVEAREMSHLICENGKQAEEMWQKHQDGEECSTDPLLTCFLMISIEAIKQGGPEMLLPDEKGNEKCPICEAVKYTPDLTSSTEDNWTNGVADAVLQDFRERKLVTQLQ